MSQSPADVRSTGTLTQEALHTIASQQKAILTCIMIYIVAVIGQFLIPEDIRPFLGLGVLVVIIIAAVFVFMLAIKLFGTAKGVVLGIITLIPLVGLISLLIVNAKATNTLKDHGIQVGLLGAKM